jgi:ketosteroid isomerase-like protein
MSGTGATETQNIAVVRRGYEAFAKGDIETLKTIFSADANWHAQAAGVLPGNYRGAQAILGFFGQLAHETDGTMRVEPLTTAASGDHVFILQRVTGSRKSKTLDIKAVLVFTVAKGVVTEVNDFPGDYPAFAHFWS